MHVLARGGCAILPLLVAVVTGSCGGGAPASSSAGTGGTSGAGGSSGLTFSAGVTAPDAGCGDATFVSDGSTGCEGLDGGVSYAHDVVPIFNNCTGEGGCHQAPNRTTTVGIAAYECCDGRFIIAPGNPDESYLVDKIEDHDKCQGVRMPFGGAMLPQSEILTIVRWICEGAPDN